MRSAIPAIVLGCFAAACSETPANAPAPYAEASARVTPGATREPSATPSAPPTVTTYALPGASAPASLDYLAYEPGASRVWVPVGGTGSVDVFDTGRRSFTRVGGFATAEREVRGEKRVAGPSCAAIGAGFAYVGDRATSEICAVNAVTLALGACAQLPTAPDGMAFVAATREVWATTPRDASIAILDASRPGALTITAVIHVDGKPEGYGVDAPRGLFFTNLEDKDQTLAVDVKTRKVAATWSPGCGADGPRGLAVDEARGLVVVACTDHLQVIDAGRAGARRGRLDTGAGVDNIDYLPSRHLVVAAAGKASRLTFARLDDDGALAIVATTALPLGARNVVLDGDGDAYAADPKGASLVVVSAARR